MRQTPQPFFLASLLGLLVWMAIAAPVFAADAVDYDANGVIRAAVDWPRETPIRAGAWIVGADWKTIVRQESLRDAKRVAGADGTFTFHGDAEIDGGRVELTQSAGPSRIEYRCVAPDADVALVGVNWFANFPIASFTGGSMRIGDRDIVLTPAKSAETRALGDATADHVTVRSGDGRTTIELTFDRAVPVRVQDVSSYGDPSFQLFVPIAEGNLARGVAHALAISIKTTLAPDNSDAIVTIDPAGKRSAFDGFGGNFVYGTDSPVTRGTLDALRLTWARVPLELREWEPTNDNGDAKLSNAAALAAHDVPGSKLRKRFELDRELFKRSEGRMIASVWYLPEWLFAEPIVGDKSREQAGIVPRERWPELAECVVSYLLHLKNAYGVEPRLFSFNESDLGVYVKLDGESMRDLTKLFRARFAEAGLKTKLLLGDSADLAKGLEQIAPTLVDDEARGFVGALAYHPWAGQNDQWPAWADLAEKHGLPLLTTEMGADADAWRDGSFATPRYALRLAKRYVEQLSTARSSAILEWEWSDDFAMTAVVDGVQKLSPRGEWLKRLTNRTPQFGETIATTVDKPTMRAATVARDDAWTVHVINLDAERTVRIRGLPVELKSMTLAIVDPIAGSLPDRKVTIEHGEAAVALPAGAMAVLSTEAK